MEFDYTNYFQKKKDDHTYMTSVDKAILLNQTINKKCSYSYILDIGCGNGQIINYFKKYYDAAITGLDISKYSIDLCKRKYSGDFILHDINEDLPFETMHFHLIIMADILEHVQDPVKLMNQALNVGKEFIIKLPLQYTPKIIPDKNGHLHFWHYSKDALLWFKQFRFVILNYHVESRRSILDYAIYNKTGMTRKLLILFRWVNQYLHIPYPREESIFIYGVKN